MRHRKTLAALGSIAALLSGIALAASAAAAPDGWPDATTGSITVTKIDGTPVGPGTGLNDPAADAMDPWTYSAEFELFRFTGTIPADALYVGSEAVAFDILSNAHWEWAAAQDPANPIEGWESLGYQTVTDTPGGNVLVWDNLPFGFYRVVERTSGNPEVDVVDPFHVMLPMYIAGDWHENVYVYPKNFVDPDITVEKGHDGPAFVGDDVTWTIDSVIPIATTEGELLVGAEVVDAFNACLAPDADSVVVQIVDGDTVVATLDVDDDFDLDVTDGVVTVSINIDDHEDTVMALRANGGNVLRVTIVSEVLECAAGTYIINSASTRWFTDEDDDPDPVIPTEPPSLDFRGSLNVIKHHFEYLHTDLAGRLEGAGFRVFSDAALTNELTTVPLMTGEDGLWLDALADLPVGAWVYLVEVVTPDGFIPLVAPIRVQISGAGGIAPEFECAVALVDGECFGAWNMVEDTGTAPDTTYQAVANVPTDGGEDGGFRLPMTGGAGVAMFSIIGLAAAAGLVALFSKKKADA